MLRRKAKQWIRCLEILGECQTPGEQHVPGFTALRSKDRLLEFAGYFSADGHKKKAPRVESSLTFGKWTPSGSILICRVVRKSHFPKGKPSD